MVEISNKILKENKMFNLWKNHITHTPNIQPKKITEMVQREFSPGSAIFPPGESIQRFVSTPKGGN